MNFVIASIAINEFNEDSIINLVLFGSEKYHKEREKYLLTLLVISELLKNLMNHNYNH